MEKKVIIFDFDGTFYSGEHIFDKVEEHVSKNRRKFLPNIDDEKYLQICNENPSWLKAISGNEIVDSIYSLKEKYTDFEISTEAFWQWQQDDIYEIVFDDTKVTNAKEIHIICQKHPTYIVSNSSPNHLLHYMQKIGVCSEWFVKVISNKFLEEDRTKLHYYKDIMELENVPPQNVFVFGDSDINDLDPARKLHMNTFKITDAIDLVPTCLNVLNK